jgi:hypothetical protein
MDNAQALQDRVADINAKSLCVQFPAHESVNPPDNLSSSRQTEQTQPLTDEEREASIYRAGNAMQAWYSHYRQSGDSRMLDMAYAALGLMRSLIAGRSPEQVARMERERGLA